MHIDITNTELTKPFLYLCKPNRDIIYNLYEAYDINHKISLGQINELSFSLPYEIDQEHQLIKNPHINMIKHRYLIKYVFGNYIEWFMINIPTDDSSDDSDIKNVECLSLGYELNDKIIRGYDELSLTATEFYVDILDGTIWNVGYISPNFDLMHRAFEITSSTVLDMIFEGATTYGGLIKWDTENRTISLYEYEQIGINQGLIFDYGQYLKTIKNTIDPDDFCTRIYITGKDGTTIHKANPTGNGYIENFSFFIDKFTRDENKVVLTHSDYMSDSLCNALLDYQDLVASKQNIFFTLMDQLTSLQSNLLVAQGNLTDLNGTLTEILDELDIAQSTGGSTTEILTRKSNKEAEIAQKQSTIDSLNASITSVNAEIAVLNDEISMENNFTSKQIIELNIFTIEKEVNNEYISDPKQLFAWGEKQLNKLIEPTINIDIDVVNFLQCLDPECITNSVKLSLSGGDIVRVVYKKFNIDIEATITEIDLKYESEDINLTISNIKDIRKDREKFLDMMNKANSTSLTVSMDKYKWNGIESTSNEVAILMKNLWDKTAETLKASVNEFVQIGRQGIIITDPLDSARLIRLTHGVLGCSKDNGNSFDTAITADGIIAEKIYGQLIIGQNLFIDASSEQAGQSFFKVDETGVWITGTALHIDGGDFSGTDPNAVHFDQQYNSMILSPENGISITNATNLKSRIVLNAADELSRTIRIQKSSDGKAIDDEFKTWNDVLYTDASGNLNLNGNMTGGTITIGSGSNIFKVDGLGMYLGSETYTYAPFRVNPTGLLYAEEADIQGSIDCSELMINGESILEIAQSMINNSTFLTKINSLGLEMVDPSHLSNKMFLQRKMLGTPPVDHGVEVLVTDGTNSYSMYTDDTVPLIPTFNLAFNNAPFIKRNLVDNITYAEGTWNFSDSLVVSDTHFESGQAEWNASGITFPFENDYSERPIYLVHPPCNTNTIQNETLEYTGINVVPIGGQSGDLYNVIAFCRGFLRKKPVG